MQTLSRNAMRTMSVEELAKRLPTLSPATATFAAEILGERGPTALVVATLLPMLSDPSPHVREGVVYGLTHHLVPEVVEALQARLIVEQSHGVFEAIEEVLEDLEDEISE